MTEWLLILPILHRLYTSVIPLDPENIGPQVSWSTDMSPTTLFLVAEHCRLHDRGAGYGEGCTRGSAWLGGCLEGYTGTHPGPSQDQIFSIFKAKGPTHGQKKLNYEVFMRFPKKGSRIDPE